MADFLTAATSNRRHANQTFLNYCLQGLSNSPLSHPAFCVSGLSLVCPGLGALIYAGLSSQACSEGSRLKPLLRAGSSRTCASLRSGQAEGLCVYRAAAAFLPPPPHMITPCACLASPWALIHLLSLSPHHHWRPPSCPQAPGPIAPLHIIPAPPHQPPLSPI